MSDQRIFSACSFGYRVLRLAASQAEWSQAVFGPDDERGPIGALKHLRDEVDETLNAPDDVSEYADCLLLTIESARRAGFSVDELLAAAERKHVRNRCRRWPTIGEQTADEPVRHKAEGDA